MVPIKVLIVDDSAIYRMLVNNALSGMPGVNVVGRCRDGAQAIESIRIERPDLITLDVEMPVMDGLSTLRKIRELSQMEFAFRHVRVVLLSSLTKKGTDTTIQGLNEGAMECIPKPEEGDVERNKEVLAAHLQKAVDLVRAQLGMAASTAARTISAAQVTPAPAQKPMQHNVPRARTEVLLIGVSTGGPAALTAMLPDLALRTSLPILVVQHMPPGFTKSLAESLAKKCAHKVVEATEGEQILGKHIYIAPGGKHMTVAKGANGVQISLNELPPENGCRPAVDVLFRSAALVYGGHAVAAILTGMGSDGTLGAKTLKTYGVPIIVQDKESSVVWGMPGSAVEAGVVDEVATLAKLAETISKSCL